MSNTYANLAEQDMNAKHDAFAQATLAQRRNRLQAGTTRARALADQHAAMKRTMQDGNDLFKLKRFANVQPRTLTHNRAGSKVPAAVSTDKTEI